MRILEELVIVLSLDERESLLRFMSLYFIGYILLFGIISYTYYIKQSQMLKYEIELLHHIKVAQCKRENALLKTTINCNKIIKRKPNLTSIYEDIIIGFIVSFIIFLFVSYYLARASIKPMQEAYSLIDDFIDGIVHDINTPLSTIMINSKSIAKNHTNNIELKIDRVIKSASNIYSLQEQLLYIISKKDISVSKVKFNLNEILKDRLNYYNGIREGVEVELNMSDLVITSDIKLITRVIDNVVLNAIKYSYSSSKVMINVDNTLLQVIDSGKGIDDVNKVFAKYHRENKSVNGIGIGLYIVKILCQKLDIDVSIKSKLGSGTRVIFDLSNIKN